MTYNKVMQDFEWDENKRLSNVRKHLIDFADATEVFRDKYRLESVSSRKGERRYQTIGTINEVVIFVAYVLRSEKRRIISARRASKNERATYHRMRCENERRD